MTAQYPFEGKTLDLDGLSLHYLDEGSGAPVVMVHGNPTWSFYYRNLVLSLRGDYRAIVPDHIGCGRSSKPTDEQYEYTLERRIQDLGRLLDELELNDINLVVHDWGGMIGFGWATRNPDRIARLVVMNTNAFPIPPSKRLPISLSLARAPGLGALMVRGLNGFVRTANMVAAKRGLSREVAAGYAEPYDSWSNRIGIHRFVQDIPLRPSDRSRPALDQMADNLERLADKPMLICWGMRDFVFDHHFLSEWERRFPKARVHRFEDGGHYVLEDKGDEIAKLVGEFLASGTAGGNR